MPRLLLVLLCLPARAEEPVRLAAEEVSIGDFEQFVQAGGYEKPELWTEAGRTWLAGHPGGMGAELRKSGRLANHPVVAVSFHEAQAYCAWRGARLPTEEEWMAAVCPDGRRFPWGEDEDFGATWYHGGKGAAISSVATVPVDQQDEAMRSPGGLRHAAGNVWEWVDGDAGSSWKLLKGGSYQNLPSYCSCAHREPADPDEGRLTAGFRCVQP